MWQNDFTEINELSRLLRVAKLHCTSLILILRVQSGSNAITVTAQPLESPRSPLRSPAFLPANSDSYLQNVFANCNVNISKNYVNLFAWITNSKSTSISITTAIIYSDSPIKCYCLNTLMSRFISVSCERLWEGGKTQKTVYSSAFSKAREAPP